MQSPFVLEKSEYKRDLNLLKGYFGQNVLFLHKMTGQPRERCMKSLRRQLSRSGKFPLRDPNMKINRQESPGNRVQDTMTLLNYVKEVSDTNRILSPSMVCYERPEVIKSPSAIFVEGGIAARKKAKGEEFLAKVRKDKVLEKIKKAEQNAKKISINSLSGMHGFAGNILFIKSGHSSLTSMCRTATGFGNANNERLLAGSRHYWSVDIALSNMLSLLDGLEYAPYSEAMELYGLVYPSVEETAACIRRSTDLYWRAEKQFQKLVDFIERLEPLERAIIVYTGDLYHLAQYNDAFIRGFMDRLIKTDCSKGDKVYDKPTEYLEACHEDTKVLAIYMNAEFMRGTTIAILNDTGRNEELQILCRTVDNIQQTLQDYFMFIRVFLTPKQLPPTVANIRGILRRVVLASDTDSTIFTTQHWVEWYTGSLNRSKEGDGIWYTTTYIACQCIVHVLAMFSANMGVSPEYLHRLAMKNEFAFPEFVLTSRAKHYYASRSCQEGNVFAEPDMEIKGVGLRSSQVTVEIIRSAQAFMKEVVQTVSRDEQFDLHYVYGKVWRLEREIYDSIKKGEHKYLKSGQIQETYANLETSNYRHYTMWNQIFGPKYGNAEPPPYSIIKVPLRIRNKTDMKEWLDHCLQMDSEFGQRLAQYCVEKNRDTIKTLMLPYSILSGIGMPEEVMPFIDIRRLTYETLESWYMVLESLGIFQVDSNYVRLVSDIYTPPGETNVYPPATLTNSLLEDEYGRPKEPTYLPARDIPADELIA